MSNDITRRDMFMLLVFIFMCSRLTIKHDTSVELLQHNKDIIINIDIPGDIKDYKVDINKDILSITGNRIDCNQNNYPDYSRSLSSIKYGKFSKSVKLPRIIANNKITTSMSNGVMNIEIKDE